MSGDRMKRQLSRAVSEEVFDCRQKPVWRENRADGKR
jgi:hypothetical protein